MRLISKLTRSFLCTTSGPAVGLLVVAAGLFAPSAFAQVNLTQAPNLPTTVVLNRDACRVESDSERLFLRWILTGPEPAYDILFRSFPGDELPSNTCPSILNANIEGVDILSSPFQFIPDGQNEMDIQFNVFPRDLTSEDACEGEGLRDTQRTLCLYVLDINTGLEEFRTQTGTGVSVDTQDPDRVTLGGVVAGDGRVTVDIDGPTAVGGEDIQYEVQYRRCAASASDGGTVAETDGGDKSAGDDVKKPRGDVPKMDDGGIHLDGGTIGDAGTFDAGAERDAGIERDAGAEDDAGVVDIVNDAGVIPADEDLTGPSSCGAVADYSAVTEDGPTVEITGLTNGATYEIRVRAVDDFGNAGLFSDRVLRTPIAEVGFMAVYEGGKDPLSFDPTPLIDNLASGDGCSGRAVHSSNTPWAMLGLLALLGVAGFGRRRRRRQTSARGTLGAFGLIAAVSLSTTPANAALGDVTVQAGVGPYTPNLDAGQSFPAYACLYADSLIIPRFDVDVGLHVFDAFGSVQLNLGLGVSQARGKAQPVGGPQVNPYTGLRDCQPVADDATSVELTQLTLRPGLSYRADQLLDYFGIPLVPYGRVGFLVGGYAFTKSGLYDNARVDQGINPAGVRLGLEGAVGLMLALDWWDSISIFSSNTTKRAQALGVFKHAFFYGEIAAQSLDTFGAPGPNLTPTDYVFRTELPIMFSLGVAMEF